MKFTSDKQRRAVMSSLNNNKSNSSKFQDRLNKSRTTKNNVYLFKTPNNESYIVAKSEKEAINKFNKETQLNGDEITYNYTINKIDNYSSYKKDCIKNKTTAMSEDEFNRFTKLTEKYDKK